MSSAKQIIKNTGFLYMKMIISIFIALYSTRLVLNALGADDFGIFNLVAGVIAMLSFLNAAMAASTQRYMSYYLGAGETYKLQAVFRSSVLLHLIIGFLIVVLLEVAGLFLFNGFLNIPAERVETAKIVYHFMVVSTFFTINAVPYDAAINAHENMLFDALSGVLESFLKLGIAIWLIFSQTDRLILYGLLTALLTIVIRIIKSIYCTKSYNECSLRTKAKTEIPLLKEMFSFAGWNMFGALCGLGRSQGIAIILNLFFSTIINAAYGIAHQVNSQVYAFTANMLKALNPQIIKSEGSGDRQRMLRLSMMASKYGFFLLALFAIPLIYEMPFVLKLWLKNVPEHTVIFCRLIMVSTLANLLTIGLQTAIQATGEIKLYQSVVGGLLLLNLPIAWLLLYLGYPAYSVLISMIAVELTACGFRILFLRSKAGLSVTEYFLRVILKIATPVTVTVAATGIPFFYLQEGWLRLIAVSGFSTLVFVAAVYFTGTIQSERQQANDWATKSLNRVFKR